jgi:hypothetical protein
LIVSKKLFVTILIKKLLFLHPHIDPVTVPIVATDLKVRASQLSRDVTAGAGFLRSTAVVLGTVIKETPCTICIFPSLGDVFYRDTSHAEIYY